MTETEKMLAGELYDASEKSLSDDRRRAKRICEEYNRTPRENKEARKALLKSLLGKAGNGLIIESNVWFDYGYNTEVGENFYCNHECVFLDGAKITFGDNVFVGPQCGFYTAVHPLDAASRNKGIEIAKPITVGNSVWFGGGVKVMPGVTIGDGAVIGGGSVITRDIPANSVAVGNPARVIKKIEQ